MLQKGEVPAVVKYCIVGSSFYVSEVPAIQTWNNIIFYIWKKYDEIFDIFVYTCIYTCRLMDIRHRIVILRASTRPERGTEYEW